MGLYMIRRIFLYIATLLIYTNVYASEEKIPKVLLKYNVQSVGIDNDTYLVFNFNNIEHWHTYWKNPGDAGFGPRFKFTDLDQNEVQLNTLEWPSPSRYIEPGDIWAYGYEGEYSFFYRLPRNYNNIINLEITWLICKHICIPGNSTINLEIERSQLVKTEMQDSKLQLKSIPIQEIKTRFKKLPSLVPTDNVDIDIVLAKEAAQENTLALYYNTTKINNLNFLNQRNLLFAYPHPYLEFKHEELYEDKSGAVYAKTLIDWNGMYQEPEVPFPTNNILPKMINLSFDFYNSILGKSYRINRAYSKLYDGKKLNEFLAILKPIQINIQKDQKRDSSLATVKTNPSNFMRIFNYILFALLGGFILNFMPCVLPVISLKIFGLVNQASQNRSQITKHNLLYTAGVLVTFLVFALVVIAIKMSGQAIGWGFQMQSPTFIATISIFLFMFALNLFGLYEFITPGGNTLGSIQMEGAKGDFLNGVLATILSTPCSAPFLGTALAFAFTSGPHIIVLIFLSVGVGLASPFLLTALFPAAIRFFPKPGNWMIHFKKFLGLSLLITVFWLVSIFIQLNTSDFSLYLLISLFMIGPIAVTIYQKVKKSILVLAIAFIITILGLFTIKNSIKEIKQSNSSVNSEEIRKFGMTWNRWNPDIINQYQGDKIKTFIDFTADWCLTCKVNEKLVINTDSFRRLIKSSGANLILGDWTDGNPEMTKWLQQNDMAGVPAYFIIDKQGNLHNLGETVSLKSARDLLN
jgi:thiol:disulfide interchange protein/DsbC/DsbD-like thiol-disulfide interchange protein